MPEIVLSTLNAKFIHCAFGLRYLLANLGDVQSRAALAEFDINQRPLEIVDRILALEPRILGFGVYIWNVTQTTEVVALIKRLRPEIRVVLGGPEVSYETAGQPIVELADHVITGEADLAFAALCRDLLEGRGPAQKVIAAALPDLNSLALPYGLYDERDVAHRIVYVEASRGCPYSCEFCLSSLDIPVRAFPLPAFLEALSALLARGVRHFKFVDRTFNLSLPTSQAILRFFLDRLVPGLFLHFEMVPDRLPPELRELIVRFPAGALQFEIGIQTFNPQVGSRISRRQNEARIEENFNFLRRETGVHLHADLIVGLPGETLESFAAGFDRLLALDPQEIQVGILKRLRGTPIMRHDQEWGMVYSPLQPYEILQSRVLDFATLQRLRHFARAWDLVINSGNFATTGPLLWRRANGATSSAPGAPAAVPSPFFSFLQFSDWLFAQAGQLHGIALTRLAEWLFRWITGELEHAPEVVARSLQADFAHAGRNEQPAFLHPYTPGATGAPKASRRSTTTTKRQTRHLGAA